MSRENYDLCVTEVLKSEGGYTNDPVDPGGATNFGITIHDYRAYINPNGTSHNVKEMTVDQAKAIYRSKYWNAVNGDELPAGVDYCVFDYGVNSGVARANRVYSHMVPLQYSHTQTDLWLIDQICDERLRFLKQLRTWYHFGKGWSARVAHVRALSKQMAAAIDHKPPGEAWHTTQTKNSPQQLMQSSTTSSPLLIFKVWLILWLKTFFTGWSRGKAPTAL